MKLTKHLGIALFIAFGLTGCTQPTQIGPKPDKAPTAAIALECATCSSERVGPMPLRVTFDASGSTDDHGIILAHWDLGNGREATGLKVETAYEQAGRYEIKLTVYDQKGQTATTRTEITVLAPPPLPFRVERAENELIIVERVLPNRALQVGEKFPITLRVTAKRQIEYFFWREIPSYALSSPERLEFMVLQLRQNQSYEWTYDVEVEDSGASKIDGDGRAAWRAEAAELTLSTIVEVP